MGTAEIIPNFSLAAMEAELRRILAIQATQIAHVGSEAAARLFLGGLEFEYWTNLDDGEISKIDLSHFYIHRWLRRAYDFAFQCGEFWRFDGTMYYDIWSFVEGTVPQSAIEGEVNPLRQRDSLVLQVVDLARARWDLGDAASASLSIRQLALLTGKSEKTVRNLISAEKVELDDHGRLHVETARKWLDGRPGFVPNRGSEYRQLDWQAFARSMLTSQGLAKGLASVLDHRKPETLPEIDEALLQAIVAARSFPPNIEALQVIGRALDLDTPHFVGLAVETSLRG